MNLQPLEDRIVVRPAEAEETQQVEPVNESSAGPPDSLTATEVPEVESPEADA